MYLNGRFHLNFCLMHYFSLLSLTLLLLLAACNTNRIVPTQVPQTGQHVVLLLDSAQAAQTILLDRSEDFFAKIRPLDMSLQMRQTLPAGFQRKEVLNAYKTFLQKDMRNFKEEEARFLQTQIQKAFQQCQALGVAIFPDTLLLLKTAAQHYGPSVYYTREKTIIFPFNELEAAEESSFLAVVYHELFHVYSRNNPKKKAELYELIGFEYLESAPVYSAELDARVLLNPDGVDDRWAVRLPSGNNESELFLPLIMSRYPNFIPGRPQFFNYLDFGLYPLLQQADGSYQVSDGGSPSPELMKAYLDKIGRNTQYIIHPDEILADNFMLLMMAKGDPQGVPQLEESGRALLESIRQILLRP